MQVNGLEADLLQLQGQSTWSVGMGSSSTHNDSHRISPTLCQDPSAHCPFNPVSQMHTKTEDLGLREVEKLVQSDCPGGTRPS